MSGPAMGCADVEALAPELALGIVSGPERASALDHLANCPSCRRLLEELAPVADSVLLLAPEVEPSIGFESRVLAATAAPERRTDAPRRRQPLRVAAAAAALIVTAGVGLAAGLAIADDDPPVRTALAVSASGRATCRAFAFGDEQAWVFVDLQAPREWTADYTVEVTTAAGGSPATVGQFHLQGGHASLGATVDLPAARLRAVRVLDAAGALRYEAPFRS